MEVVINGVTWRKNPEPKTSGKRFVRRGQVLAASMMMAGAFDMWYGSKSRKRPDVDIVKEYELIQQKKSNLSRNDREWVVSVFEKEFTKV